MPVRFQPRAKAASSFPRLLLSTIFLLALISLVPPLSAQSPDPLESGFLYPPSSAKPWVNWFWLDGNITRAGITADLEAMQRVGIGGALLMDVSQEIPPGPVKFGSQEWLDLFNHTLTEARRLGLEISLNNAPGWSGSGGPWITPALAMQKVVWTKTNLFGPARFEGSLPHLPAQLGYSRDIAILAFPTLAGDGAPPPGFAPKWSSNFAPRFDGAALLDGDPSTFVTLPAPAPSKPVWIQLEFTNAFNASHLSLASATATQSFAGSLQVSEEGRKFREVRPFSSRGSSINLLFEEISSRWFRIVFTSSSSNKTAAGLQFSELELSPDYRIHSFQTKTGLGQNPAAASDANPIPPAAMIAPEAILDLTDKTNARGDLVWDVPQGRWTLLRIGHTPIGTENHPTTGSARGLECDKLSREAMDAHFGAFIGRLHPASASDSTAAFTQTHIDSWEVGYQNWTSPFRQEFSHRRGYDLLQYLPALTGRVVRSPEITERFLWDFRRTIADLVADNYASHLASLAHDRGMKLSIEAYGLGPFDDLQLAARADIPMGEFWADPTAQERFDSCRAMASAAHIHGQPIVAAEAFTSYPATAKWLNDPYSLKPLADEAFCAGVNRLVIHRFAHQPWLDRAPGMTMGAWGVHYERTETWWEKSQPWHEYLARCQFLLQQGLFAADICQITDEGAFNKSPSISRLLPGLPPGYSADLADPEAVSSRMSIENDRVVLPDGMSYRMLVLPSTRQMTPPLLRKIRDLVYLGATIVGFPPTNSPSLANFPQCDAEVQALAAEVWGDCDGIKTHEHVFGGGRIFAGLPIKSVLDRLRLAPDFQPGARDDMPELRFIHRMAGDTDFYFIANGQPREVTTSCSFRVQGKQPEFWHPDSGEIEHSAYWQEQGDLTTVPLRLDPAGSVFVVLRQRAASSDHIISAEQDGQPLSNASILTDGSGHFQFSPVLPGHYQFRTASGKELKASAINLPNPSPVSGPWKVTFPPNLGAPEAIMLPTLDSWTANSLSGVKYFSGTATYHKEFNPPPSFWDAAHTQRDETPADPTLRRTRIWLDLGRVEVIASIKLNGYDLGTLWKPPFKTDITDAIVTGTNSLEIQIANLWPNRLIGDEQLPDDCRWFPAKMDQGSPLAEWPQWLLDGKPSPTGRVAFTTWKHWTKEGPLLDSGLLGPVTLKITETIQFSD